MQPSVAAELRHDAHLAELLFGELCLHVEAADGLHLIAEEVDTVGELAGIGEDIEDASPHGILSRFVHVIDVLKAIAVEHLADEGGINPLTRRQSQCLLCQLIT